MVKRLLIFWFIAAAFSASYDALAAGDVAKLRATAKEFHAFAEKKMIQAASETDPDKKEALLGAARQLEESAEMTLKKAEEEEILSRNDEVAAARAVEASARASLASAEQALENARGRLTVSSDGVKERAEASEAFMNAMTVYRREESAHAGAASRMRDAEERALR